MAIERDDLIARLTNLLTDVDTFLAESPELSHRDQLSILNGRSHAGYLLLALRRRATLNSGLNPLAPPGPTLFDDHEQRMAAKLDMTPAAFRELQAQRRAEMSDDAVPAVPLPDPDR